MKDGTVMPGWSAVGGQTISPYVGPIVEGETLLGHSVRRCEISYLPSANSPRLPGVLPPAPPLQWRRGSVRLPWGRKPSDPSLRRRQERRFMP